MGYTVATAKMGNIEFHLGQYDKHIYHFIKKNIIQIVYLIHQ